VQCSLLEKFPWNANVVGMSHDHWPHGNFTRFKKWFWLFLAKVTNGESFVFSWSFSVEVTNGESFVFLCHFWPRILMVKVFVFLCHFWPRLPMMKVFDFLAFSAKDTNGESFVFSWSFLAKVTNGESFGFSWLFLAKVANGESFCFSLTFLAKVAFIGHFGYEYQWWKFCLWFEILSNLWHPALPNASVRWRQSLAPYCASRSSRSGRQLLAWDCKYKRWHASTSISYPGMERVNIQLLCKKRSSFINHIPNMLTSKENK